MSAETSHFEATSYLFNRGFPSSEAAQRARDDAAFMRAVTAYRFWYPTVSVEGIFNGNREAGLGDNEKLGIAAAGPLQVGFTLNSDTPYGAGTLDLSGGPMVIELPAGPFIGLVDDHHQRWVTDMGIPGRDEGKGGKYVILPPGYEGVVPDGYLVGRSGSFKALLALRAIPVGGDLARAMDALREVRIYPLSTAADPQLMEFVDSTDIALDNSSLRWESNIGFWEVLHQVIDAEPTVDEFRPMYGLLSALGIEKGTPFDPDPRMRDTLEEAARAGRDQMLVSAFASERPDRIAWPGLSWEWVGLVPENADFETAAGLDLEARDRWFAQAIVASPAMFRRQEGAGSLYWLSARDSAGAFLDGAATYRLDVPQPVPGKLFWSITVYDAETRSQLKTDQGKAALRSMFELADVAGETPVALHFGPDAPAGEAKTRWIKTIPDKGWFAYVRIYGPEQPAFDGSWRLPDFERVD
jgi:hypothetical protein